MYISEAVIQAQSLTSGQWQRLLKRPLNLVLGIIRARAFVPASKQYAAITNAPMIFAYNNCPTISVVISLSPESSCNVPAFLIHRQQLSPQVCIAGSAPSPPAVRQFALVQHQKFFL